jgi:hypothetical protein
MCVKVFVNGSDMTDLAFHGGDNLQKEIAFLVWFAQGADLNSPSFVKGFVKYHRAPRRVNVFVPGKGTMVAIKEKAAVLFEVYID